MVEGMNIKPMVRLETRLDCIETAKQLEQYTMGNAVVIIGNNSPTSKNMFHRLYGLGNQEQYSDLKVVATRRETEAAQSIYQIKSAKYSPILLFYRDGELAKWTQGRLKRSLNIDHMQAAIDQSIYSKILKPQEEGNTEESEPAGYKYLDSDDEDSYDPFDDEDDDFFE